MQPASPRLSVVLICHLIGLDVQLSEIQEAVAASEGDAPVRVTFSANHPLVLAALSDSVSHQHYSSFTLRIAPKEAVYEPVHLWEAITVIASALKRFCH